MLGHIHYSTNVYKKIGTGFKSTDNQEVKNLRKSFDLHFLRAQGRTHGRVLCDSRS